MCAPAEGAPGHVAAGGIVLDADGGGGEKEGEGCEGAEAHRDLRGCVGFRLSGVETKRKGG